MAWFKVDDKLHSSRKLMQIPRRHRLAAIGLWTVAGSWAADQLTDGHVPDFMIDEWGGTTTLVDALVSVRLWARVPVEFPNSSVESRNSTAEFRFWNWEEYQPTKAEVEAGREKNAEKLRKWRERNRVTQPDVTELQGGYEPLGNPAPDPTRPDPTPITSKEVIKERPASRGSRLSPEWMPSAASVATAKTDAPDIDCQAEHSTFVDYWIAQPGQKGVKTNWESTWRNWMRRKQADVKSRPTRQTPEQRARATLALATDIDMKGISA
ncbi:hypothetical protein [Cryobacterium sp. GrIS_2_6]|uniref:hypothetical protein n=1 Tax=Cryobacterium sp. GrIS_2_6 TaxID=3162785 RepID=UPI002DF73E62|nr:hypothetical protein [Cryobacterium psychrotolerans]MEC5149267.1 hypothetical protein [Cryobacterium psychrotolerans]MEC5149345.1 hypothetical protein [Cryobacterium psychrotolerans]